MENMRKPCQRYNRMVKFRCTSEQYLRIVEKSERFGYSSVSEFIRVVVINGDKTIDKLMQEEAKKALEYPA